MDTNLAVAFFGSWVVVYIVGYCHGVLRTIRK